MISLLIFTRTKGIVLFLRIRSNWTGMASCCHLGMADPPYYWDFGGRHAVEVISKQIKMSRINLCISLPAQSGN